MDDIWTLIILSLAMLMGCYIAGAVPLAFTLSEEKLKLITVLGAGMLVGTALAVIIPEGVHAMYTTDSYTSDEEAAMKLARRANDQAGDFRQLSQELVPTHDEHMMEGQHSIIGVALVAGFLFMLLVDQMGGGSLHSHTPVADDPQLPSVLGTSGKKKITATVGLVVHAAADGVAMGAALAVSKSHITTIVFLAIMMHKAPAAFGLVSFLLHENLERSRIRVHLLVFSVAAPILTIFTYFGLSQTSAASLSDLPLTGVALLLSAGTFLYVSTVHILPEVATTQHRHTLPDGTLLIRDARGLTNLQLVALVVGAVVPVLLAVGHSH